MSGEPKALTPAHRDDLAAKVCADAKVIERLRRRVKVLEAQIRRTGATPRR